VLHGLALVASCRRVNEKIEQYELTRTIDPAHLVPKLDEAVAEYLRHGSRLAESRGGTVT
jgi:hypothetical protein